MHMKVEAMLSQSIIPNPKSQVPTPVPRFETIYLFGKYENNGKYMYLTFEVEGSSRNKCRTINCYGFEEMQYIRFI